MLGQTVATGAGAPPATPKKPVAQEYHEVSVSDDYQWLENWDDPEVRGWNQAQNQSSRTYLDRVAFRTALKQRLSDYYGKLSPSYYGLKARNGRLFAIKFQPPKEQPMLVVLSSPDETGSEKVLIDPNAAGKVLSIDWYVPSWDGRLIATAMSEKGSEDATLHIYDVETGKPLSDRVPRVNYPTGGGSAAWDADNSGLFYTRYPQNDERPAEDRNFYQQVWYHKLGTPASQDRYVIGKDFPRIAEIDLDGGHDGRYIVASVANGDGGEYAHYLRGGDGRWIQLTRFEDKAVSASLGRDGAVYLVSHQGAPKGRVLRLSPSAPELSKAETVVPEAEHSIERGFYTHPVVATRDRLYVLRLAGGPSQVDVYDLKGRRLGELPLPAVSSVQDLEEWGEGILVSLQSYIEPPAWHRFGEDGRLTRTALFTQAPIDFEDAEVSREMATSKDGTKVPVNIIRRKGAKLDGSNPVLLTAYGGYGISLKPRFLGIRGRLWLDQGGVYAVANIRGGGEFGEAWHKAGNLTRKQNVFDDFASCARHLIDRKYTSPDKLVIEGGSNGGLLMGAQVTQNPSLYRAVVSHVGIYDMLRVELDPNGAFNVTEFGTVKDSAQFKALYDYSPYHRVIDGTAYPAVLFLHGEHDGRVNPAQSRKMAARLQAASGSGRPVLLRTSASSGHGMGTALSDRIEEEADVWVFVLDQLGLKFDAGPDARL
ncbi:MAG: S9 family peptidase [Elusimicrobia bacterium]|nr:S9 family peptidase [Elusimicrobiota bacterium]